MTYSARFYKIAQLLFTSQISDDEKKTAEEIVDVLEKNELDFQNWLDAIQKNLDLFNNYHGSEEGLVVISEKFEEIQKQQKEKYEKIITDIKKAIDLMGKMQDVEMQDMINNLTKVSEDFTELFNELNNLPVKIGEKGFAQKFKDASQVILDNNEPFLDILERIKNYIMKNVMGEQSLS